jgi:hypothetical protein
MPIGPARRVRRGTYPMFPQRLLVVPVRMAVTVRRVGVGCGRRRRLSRGSRCLSARGRSRRSGGRRRGGMRRSVLLVVAVRVTATVRRCRRRRRRGRCRRGRRGRWSRRECPRRRSRSRSGRRRGRLRPRPRCVDDPRLPGRRGNGAPRGADGAGSLSEGDYHERRCVVRRCRRGCDMDRTLLR